MSDLIIPAIFIGFVLLIAGCKIRSAIMEKNRLSGIEIVRVGGIQQCAGEFSGQNVICQEFVESPVCDGFRPQFGVWMLSREPVALGIRETGSLIVTGDSPFVPHAVEG